MKPLHAVAIALLGWATLGGCGSGYNATVDGIVTLDGNVLTNGTVSFHPADEGPVAYGQIQSDGSYQATTGSTEGIKPGDYVVTVVATKPDPDPADEKPPEPLTPAKYASPKTSDLKITIDSGKNDRPLELKSR